MGPGKVYITFVIILHGLSSLLLQEPCFHIPPLTQVCSEGLLAIGGSQQGAGEPSYAFRQATPLHWSFSSWNFYHGAPISPAPLQSGQESESRACILPMGNVPHAYLLSNNPVGSGSLPPLSYFHCFQDWSTAQLIWIQTPVPELGLWEAIHSVGASTLGTGSRESRGPLLLYPQPIGQAASEGSCTLGSACRWSEW